jgi:hypothetical protein
MSEIATRYALGVVFALFAVALTHVGSMFAVIPAVVSVFMLGSLLYDVWRKNV